MGQTAEDVRDNIVKISDKDGNFKGTGFFIHKEYCVTCHHNICALNEIFVERDQDDIETGEQRKQPYPAEWNKEFSDMQKDVAFLRVKNADFKPLQYGKDTYAKLPVVVRGFPFEDLNHHPDGKDESGMLSNVDVRLLWDEENVQGTREWNVKPKVKVQVFNFKGKFDLGFSGAPVCHEPDWKVVGIFEAKDDNKGYVIPMNIAVDKFERFASENARKVSASPPPDTTNTRALIEQGIELYNKKEYEKAADKYQAVLSDPNYVYALSNMGSSLSRLGRNEEAIKYLDRAIDLNANYADSWLEKANVLDELHRYKEALPCFDRALELNPINAFAWNNKGVSLFRLDNYKEAIKCYNKSLEINPNYYETWNNKGVSLRKLGRYDEALPCFDRALELNPIDAFAWNNKGESLYRLGKYEKAAACYDKALDIYPNHHYALYLRSCFRIKKGDIKEGLADLKKAIEIDKSHIESAIEDKDFDSIRTDEKFKALVLDANI